MAGPTIVIVNHDPVYLSLIERILKLEGFSPITRTMAGAHEVIVAEQPEIVMIDSWLSRRDEGLALLQTLKLDEATKEIPILIASSDPDDLAERLRNIPGRMEVLTKPFTADMLLATLNRLLDTPPAK